MQYTQDLDENIILAYTRPHTQYVTSGLLLPEAAEGASNEP